MPISREAGHTNLILEAPDGSKKVYSLDVERTTYELNEITP